MAVRILGSAAAMEIIRLISLHGPVPRAEIEPRVTSSPSTLGRLLEALIAEGVLTAEWLTGSGRGRKLLYSVDDLRLRQIMESATQYMLAGREKAPVDDMDTKGRKAHAERKRKMLG